MSNRQEKEKKEPNKIIKTIPLSIAIAALASGAAFAAVDEVHIDTGSGIEIIKVSEWAQKPQVEKDMFKAMLKAKFLARQNGVELIDGATGKVVDLNMINVNINNFDDLFTEYGV